MAVSKVSFSEATSSIVEVTVNAGDLVVVDATLGSGTVFPNGISGGGVTTWTADGASWSSTTNLVASGQRWWGVATSTGTFTVTITYSSPSSGFKTEATVFRDTAIGSTAIWSVDATSQGVVTTSNTTMTGLALTSTTNNGVAYTFWCPQNAGAAGSTSGWTYVVDAVWTNVLAHRFVTATGSVAAPTSTQSPTGRYFRHATIFKVVAGSSPIQQAAASFAGAGGLSAGATQIRAVGSVFAGQGALAPGATRVQTTGTTFAGAGSVVASVNPPAAVLNLGTTAGKNYFGLQYAVPGDSAIITKTLAELVAGFSVGPQFYTTPDDQRVHFEARIDAPTTSGASYSRAELREADASGANYGFDALSGTHSMSGTTTITHLPSVVKAVVVAQLHNGTTDRVAIRTQLVSGTVRLRLRVNGSTVGSDLIAPYTEGTEFSWKIEVVDGTLNVYFGLGGSVNPTPVYTSTALVSTGSPSWYFKSGVYNQSAVADGESATDYGAAELRNFSVSHSLPASSAQVGVGGAGALAATTFLGRLATPQGLAGSGSLGITGRSTSVVPSLDTSAEGVLSASATAVNVVLASFAGAGALGASATKTHFVSAGLSGGSSLFIAVTPNGNAALSGAGALGITGFQSHRVSAALAAESGVTADPFQLQRVTGALSGSGALVATSSRVQQGASALTAFGVSSFDGRRVQPAASGGGVLGSLSASGTRVHAAQVSMGAFGTFQARSATETGGALNVSVYVIDRTTGALIPLPDFESVTASPILNENGAIEVQYPSWGKNFDRLRSNITQDRDIEVEVWLSGRRSSALRGILMDSSGDDVAERAVWTFTGPFLNYLVSEIRVFPQSGSEKQELVISAASAGKVIRTVVQQAQSRGSLAGLTLGFSDTVDSNGLPWVNTITTTFSPGITGKSVLDTLVNLGMVEWEITKDRVLKAYAPNSFGIDRTLGNEKVILRRGRQIPEAPRKHTVRDSNTTMLVAGSEGIYNSANDPNALARRGRRIEGYATANNLTDTTSVYGFAQTALNASSPGVMELTQGVEFTPGDPRPGAAYNVGDWVFVDVRNSLERLRIKQWSLTVDSSGASGTVSLNDLITERSVTLAKRLEALSNGTATVGTSSSGEDTGIPVAPTGLTVGSQAYFGQTGEALANVTAGWNQVTKNTDGNNATDISGYNVEFRYNSGITQSGWTSVGSTDQIQKTFSDISAGARIEVRVQTVDRSNNLSTWTPAVTHDVARDSTPPAVPSTPSVENYLGVIRITWDGKSSTTADMAISFDYVEVHVSTAASFTPSDATLIGTMNAKQTLVYIDGVYGTTYYARLVAVSTSMLKSTPSGTGSAVPERVVGTDVFDGAIGTAKLADAAITTAKINDLAVNDAKIGSLNVGKLTTGIFTADMTLSGSIRTALTGQRMVIDNSGWIAYNSSGTIFARLNITNSTLLITGTYQSGMTGERVNILPDGTFRIYPATGTNYSQIANFGSDVVWRGPVDGNQRSGRVNVSAVGVGMNFCAESEIPNNLRSEFVLFDRYVRGTAPLIEFRVDGRYAAPNNERRILFKHTDGSGNDIASTVLHYINLNGSPAIVGPTQNVGLNFGASVLYITTGSGAGFRNVQAADFVTGSSGTLKDDIVDIRRTLDPLQVIRTARAKSWKYKFEQKETPPPTDENPNPVPVTVIAPTRFGPIAEDLPSALQVPTQGPEGEKTLGIGVSSQLGVLWGAVGQMMDQQIVSTSAVAVLAASAMRVQGIFPPGESVEVPVTWESTPPAAPTGGFATLSSSFIWANKVTVWIKTGSVTATGCTVIFKNISTGPVVVSNTNDATRVVASVVGLGLYSPPLV